MSSLRDFSKKKKPEDYYVNLIQELERINGRLHAFNEISHDVDRGFPISVKDNICVDGMEATASSRMLKGYKPPFDATVVQKLKDAGFSVLGKTNMDEFGFGSFGINCISPARNPFDEERVAGGSSSGAAVAASIMKYHLAIAESTGGSISAPACFCGVVGFTPTYGVISRYGLIDYANSLDKIGFIARSSEDISDVFKLSVGKDGFDSTCADFKPLKKEKDRLVIINQLYERLDKGIKASFDRSVRRLSAKGFKIGYEDVNEIGYAVPAYYIVSMAEASTNLAKYTGFKYGEQLTDFSMDYNSFFSASRNVFGEEAKRKIVLGSFIRSASVRSMYYEKALKVRRLIINRLKEILDGSFIISPSMPVLAPKIEEARAFTPVQNYSMDVLTIPPNLCGFPSISLPSDYVGGLPTGMQIIGDHMEDLSILSFGKEWEKDFIYRFKYNIGEI
ncbi:amidase family protein [Candidatus Parvarchaeota archaeon]|nr:amidase family protein [Candidatus Parvarchaeota archaeon]